MMTREMLAAKAEGKKWATGDSVSVSSCIALTTLEGLLSSIPAMADTTISVNNGTLIIEMTGGISAKLEIETICGELSFLNGISGTAMDVVDVVSSVIRAEKDAEVERTTSRILNRAM